MSKTRSVSSTAELRPLRKPVTEAEAGWALVAWRSRDGSETGPGLCEDLQPWNCRAEAVIMRHGRIVHPYQDQRDDRNPRA